jgi:hypothetical protein
MWIVLVVLLILLCGGWGYRSYDAGPVYGYGPPGILGLVLIVLLILLLLGRI